MARACEICAKKPVSGRHIARRGISKKAGGIGLKTTGITIRRFAPNLQNMRIISAGTVRFAMVCAKCLKAGKVQKAPVRTWVKAAA